MFISRYRMMMVIMVVKASIMSTMTDQDLEKGRVTQVWNAKKVLIFAGMQ